MARGTEPLDTLAAPEASAGRSGDAAAHCTGTFASTAREHGFEVLGLRAAAGVCGQFAHKKPLEPVVVFIVVARDPAAAPRAGGTRPPTVSVPAGPPTPRESRRPACPPPGLWHPEAKRGFNDCAFPLSYFAGQVVFTLPITKSRKALGVGRSLRTEVTLTLAGTTTPRH